MLKNTKTILNKIGVATLVGVLALSVSTVKADPIVGQFTITPGTLNAKLIGLTGFNSAYAAAPGTPYTYAGFTSYGNTIASAINLKTDTVNPANPSTFGSEGIADPVASTSVQAVKGAFTAAFLNGSGSSFNSTLSITNFAKADALGAIITVPSETILPVYTTANTTSFASFQGSDTVASNVTAYTGQTTTGISSEITTAAPTTSITNATSTGVSQTYTLLDFNTGTGLGEYYKRTGLNFSIPAYAQTGKYISTVTFTNTVE